MKTNMTQINVINVKTGEQFSTMEPMSGTIDDFLENIRLVEEVTAKKKKANRAMWARNVKVGKSARFVDAYSQHYGEPESHFAVVDYLTLVGVERGDFVASPVIREKRVRRVKQYKNIDSEQSKRLAATKELVATMGPEEKKAFLRKQHAEREAERRAKKKAAKLAASQNIE